jgi:hypothetical protein
MADQLAKETKLPPFCLYELRTAVLKFTESEMYEDATEIEAICSSLQKSIFEEEHLVLFSEKQAEPRRYAFFLQQNMTLHYITLHRITLHA